MGSYTWVPRDRLMAPQGSFSWLWTADAFNLFSLQHCLLGWDILPPKPEKSCVPKSLDLWSSVSCGAQGRHLSATSPSRLVGSMVCPDLG